MSAPTVTTPNDGHPIETSTPLNAVMDAAATYAAAEPGARRVARQVCVDQITAALDRCDEVNVPHLVFDLAFRLALRDQT
jgi:hypothetical protein